jgi:N,N-dimethylformamidase
VNTVSGIVCSAEACFPIEAVQIYITSRGTGEQRRVLSNSLGEWQIQDLKDEDIVQFQKPGYVPKEYRAIELPAKVRVLENQLIGYQLKLWFQPGETIEAFIHSPANYSAWLYRHGKIKEQVLFVGEFPPCQQQVPDGDFVKNGLKWSTSIVYQIPSYARPGLYSLLLRSEDAGLFAIPFIVSTPSSEFGRRSKLLVLASTNNWQTYNIWGGRSRYRNLEASLSREYGNFNPGFTRRLAVNILRHLPLDLQSMIRNKLRKFVSTTSQDWMREKLAIRRPFTNCNLEEDDPFRPVTNHLAAGEWRLLAWLEREGYDYEIISGYEFHHYPNPLNNYKAIILNTHCEYWSSSMFTKLKEFHQLHQGWILNISGNSIYREVDFFDDGSLRCTSLRFSESCADETLLLGVRFSEADYCTCAPYKIIDSAHWAFRGIPISKSKLFGGLSLIQNTAKRSSRLDPGRPGAAAGLDGCGASGWETDKLSKTAPKDTVVIAKGCNPYGGADMVVREPDGERGGLFSASSLVFSGCLLIDDVASALMKNVMNRALGEYALSMSENDGSWETTWNEVSKAG